MEESLLAKVIHALLFLAVCTAITAVGWNEPLRYRFMGAQEIADTEAAQSPPPPPPRPGPREWNLQGAALDRAPWEKKGNKIKYNTNGIDLRHVGAPTESDKRTDAIGKQ
jgi:hypothetical protein